MDIDNNAYLPEVNICIGTQFIRIYKRHRTTETVVDIHTTYNLAGEVVKIVYVAQHNFMGQVITDYEVPKATIVRSINTELFNKI